ncbi:pilus assembly protein TadE [Gordonia desulfuricans]|uniref:Pilus assembly protein TadE n=1 Tax=Gordonia desulfuricans TaxID=89051 RepID=A0A7K3LKV7_9ACTN|nr:MULTISPECIES: TadE family type IV pilus minor pilin [Gordonia]EMP14438.2 pilus assembly protein TadE [Gordonia sp. NB41Y]NDK88870.1 pilus assembly protein TadE [Gordonia desulfuricans]WLP92537.1 TadE family type IV pilus minor pilin [Gordonia sp. NB41Y]
MATVEGAYAIAAIVVVLILALGGIGAAITSIRCTDAAREVARLTAADDPDARAAGQRLVGADARITVSENDERIVVEVTDGVLMLPGLTMSARAVAVPEPDGSDQVVFAPGVQP